MSSLPLFLILLCLSVHAFNARFLKIIVKEQGHLIVEDVSKAKIHKTSIQLGLGHSVLKDERKLHMNQDGENTVKQKHYSKAFLKDAIASGGATSVDIIAASPNDLQRLAIKDQELLNSQTRSLLESSPNENDEAIDSNDYVVEDTVLMDYAQPHRKAPIHNEKP